MEKQKAERHRDVGPSTETHFTGSHSRVILVNLTFWGCVIIWSTTPLAVKWSAVGMGFIHGAFFRMLIGVVFSFIVLKVLRIPIEWNKQALRVYASAAIAIYGAMILVYWGSQFIPSGLISVIFGCAPFLTSFLAHYILKEDSLTWKKILSIGIGVGGLAIIFLSTLEFHSSYWKGLIAVVMSMICFVISNIEVKRVGIALHPLVLTFGGLLTALPLYFITWLFLDMSLPDTLDMRAVYSIIYLGIFGSVLGFFFFFFTLKHMDVSKTALITLITPIMGLFLGIFLNGETVLTSVWVGTSFIITGLLLHRV